MTGRTVLRRTGLVFLAAFAAGALFMGGILLLLWAIDAFW